MNRAGILAIGVLLTMGWGGSVIAGDCSCGQPAASCNCHGTHYCKPCHRHRRCCNCENGKATQEVSSRASRIAEIPTGPVVESMAVMRISPAVMTMQIPVMMGGVQGVSLPQERPRAETSCDSSRKDVMELEAKIQALDLRMQTIQRAVELQTQFLVELKEGKVKLPKE